MSPDGNERRLLAATWVDTVGTGMFQIAMPLYLIQVLDLSAGALSLGLFGGGLIGLFAAAPVGAYVDRHGTRTLVPALYVLQAATAAAVIVADRFAVFVLTIAVSQFAAKAVIIARYPIVLSVATQGVRVLRARLQTTANLGMAVGFGLSTVIVTALGQDGYRVALQINAGSFLVAAAIQATLTRAAPVVVDDAPGKQRKAKALRDRPFLALSVLYGLIYLQFPILSLGVPLFVASHPDLPPATSGIALILNTAAVVLLQVRTARRISTVQLAGRAWLVGGVVVAASCLALWASVDASSAAMVALVMVAVLGLTAAELLTSAGSFVLNDDLAVEGMESQYIALFQSAATVAQLTAPVAVVYLCSTNADALWLAAVWFAVVGLVAPRLAARVEASTAPEGRTRRGTAGAVA